MFEAYFDDSGTDAQSEIAVAAAYVSTSRGWKEFVREWARVENQEGFRGFHMAEFVAPPNCGHKPWCDWDNSQKDRVYGRLAHVINQNKRIGVACAVPKTFYDALPIATRQVFGLEHYTFAVRMCVSGIIKWRETSRITLPIRYVFDWEMNGTRKRQEIEKIWTTLHPSWESHIGSGREGFCFEHKEECAPLLAADILAWQMRGHMLKIWPDNEDEKNLHRCHAGFMALRNNQVMDLGFFTEEQLKKFQIQFEISEQNRLDLAGRAEVCE
jgi:hypothetical protein